ncbi:carbamoyltransferase family protein [Salinarimonas sp. NSM]|uniref:carbamoyltransferase family protein n=1 Tax=Salinarimonas sp. NSM TaxID=3458003 RepID=UPI004035F25F
MRDQGKHSGYHLGISAYYHDSAAALVRDGAPVAAAQEERFTRRRHDSSFPANAVRFCLTEAGISLSDLASVTYYERPDIKFRRTLSSFASAGPRGIGAFGRIAPEWLGWKRNALSVVDGELAKLGLGTAPKARAIEHHRSHAASAFFPSPFESAAVLCIDGVGEWHTTTIWHGKGSALELVNSVSYPHSLGLLYSAFTSFCGFKVDSGEYKLMGLAPYGEPRYADLIRREIIALRPDGSFTLALDEFEFLRGERMIGEAFAKLFGGPARDPESKLTQRECDIAASIQAVTDEAVLGLARAAKEMTGEDALCMAGGVALNCVSNGHVSRSGLFSRLWVQPAAGDAGCALGAALDTAITGTGRRVPAQPDAMKGAYLGPDFSDEEIVAYLEEAGHAHQRMPEEDLLDAVSRHLEQGAVVGWFQGRMEFGPRALGARSILGDPRNTEMQRTMNLKIKYRESFRPFAPSVLEEDAAEYFEVREESPYMLVVSPVAEAIRVGPTPRRSLGAINEVRSTLPSITHVDLSARVQTVTEARSPRYARLLRRFKALTGCPVLVNTSFNVRGEPIVCTPQEAYRCFMRTEMDVLVLGSCLLVKGDQAPLVEDVDWRAEIPLD